MSDLFFINFIEKKIENVPHIHFLSIYSNNRRSAKQFQKLFGLAINNKFNKPKINSL